MTVQSLLGNMSQKELVTWIAFHKIEQEDKDAALKEREKPPPQKTEAKITVKQPTQKQKDDLLLQQMFALVQAGKKKKSIQE